jgi:hypothetical protein
VGIGNGLSRLETKAAMRVSGKHGNGLDCGRRNAAPAPQRDEPQRALLPAVVSSTPRVSTAAAPGARPSATLLAQLVATVEQLPIARARRRADAQASAEVYRSIANLAPTPRKRASRTF